MRPHPHIGLATVTYVFAGKIMHRDSLGTVQPIQPGEVNWMTAGRGIVHSERTSMPAIRLELSCSAFRPGWPCRRAARRLSPPLRIMRGPNYRRWRGRSLEPDYSGNLFRSLLSRGYLCRSGVRRLPSWRGGAGFIAGGNRRARCINRLRRAPSRQATLRSGTLAVFTPKAEVVLTTDVATHFILIGGPKLDGPQLSGGILCRLRRNGSKRRRPTGAQGASRGARRP